ncbi:hypothetical protein CDL15_Pgr000945 [Punica granatum]|uniref:Senescence domain-containing protein n=1 Tax=Punica granatum TaxID=22663 RepID=A0A218XH13_PUNGR|nr:hypothetical protein CDL15_Pgr000945 [Punica granatum]
MGCFSCGSSRSNSSSRGGSNSTYFDPYETTQQNSEPRTTKQQVLLQIPSCTVHLMDQGEALELSSGREFTLLTISDENISLATIIKVGDDLQWPLTKDEPVVKLDSLHYLFSLPVKDGDPLSYGVTFMEQYVSYLGYLDKFLEEHSCFSSSAPASSSSYSAPNRNLNWKEFAPKINDYNNVLAKAIAGGTGQIVKGIFMCSNGYTNQVHKGGEMIMTSVVEQRNGSSYHESYGGSNGGAQKKSAVNISLKRKVSKMTDKISKKLLDGVQFATGSVMAPMVKSQAGKSFLAMVPGEVLLASLDAVDKVLDAAEAAEKQAYSATSKAATRMVSRRFGESAGEATEDALATAGHCASTAWNVFKIRKAVNPASSVSTGVLKNAGKAKNSYS